MKCFLAILCLLCLSGCAYKSTFVYTNVPGQGATVTAGGEASSPVNVAPEDVLNPSIPQSTAEAIAGAAAK